MITFENKDCMDAMKEFPDKFFDLAIVDPPYGDALDTNGANASAVDLINTNAAQTNGRFRGNGKPVSRTGGTGGGWRNDKYGKKS